MRKRGCCLEFVVQKMSGMGTIEIRQYLQFRLLRNPTIAVRPHWQETFFKQLVDSKAWLPCVLIKKMDALDEGGAEARIGSARNERVEEVKSALSQQLERFERIVSWKLNSEPYDEACVWRDTLQAVVHVMLGAGVCA